MHFYVEVDHGNEIQGWVALENPNVTPIVLVQAPGHEEIRVEPSILRLDVKEAGLHATGMVGFRINDTVIENLASIEELSIVEESTGIAIYTRYQMSRKVERKMLYLDCSLMPQTKLYKNLNENFSLTYNFVEKFSLDTLMSIISNLISRSLLLTGRLNYQRYVPFLKEKDFFITTILRNPFEELAERILFIGMLAKSNSSALLANFTTGIESIVNFSKSVDMDNDRAIALAFRKMDDETRYEFLSPMTRILGCGAGERPERRHVGMALDSLSQMNLVGTRDRFPAYRGVLSGMMRADIVGEVNMEVSPSVAELAARLSRINIVSDLIEHDLALYSYAQEAIDKGLLGDENANAA